MSITHEHLSSYIDGAVYGGNRHLNWGMRVSSRPAPVLIDPKSMKPIPEKQPERKSVWSHPIIPLDTMLFFSPAVVSAYTHQQLLQMSAPWFSALYYPEDKALGDEERRYLVSTVWNRMEEFLGKMSRLPLPGAEHPSLISIASDRSDRLDIRRDATGMWYTPSAARLAKLNLALEGLGVLPDQYAEHTEDRITRLARIGRAIREGMPLDYAREMGRL